ncbi:NUDIX domain-containing protein [Streptomyces sp. TRM66268-LWL]|uniref:NUDIX domain-containing protein n=1 Tax=Streptomyces polyasparticus TaxID=2767826 RepID=A0ABR7SVW3_9ACTN|nr:NUDIX domain-containing protein [Streptomyces polyasparticus]MBC9719630.1 NUDIX domain-containing protein [Streptomyces polyasparticus]
MLTNPPPLLAGHCEQESATACLVREAEEEAGLLISPADVSFAPPSPTSSRATRTRRWAGPHERAVRTRTRQRRGIDRHQRSWYTRLSQRAQCPRPG